MSAASAPLRHKLQHQYRDHLLRQSLDLLQPQLLPGLLLKPMDWFAVSLSTIQIVKFFVRVFFIILKKTKSIISNLYGFLKNLKGIITDSEFIVIYG